jgi:hypothetical protein
MDFTPDLAAHDTIQNQRKTNMLIKIKSRYDGRVLYECECESIRECLQKGVAADANLARANLAYANLAYANLAGANLADANLARAYLTGANLADANLVRANLTDANLVGANLTDANLVGAKINWKSHALIAEILRQSAGDDVDRRCLAGGILLSTDWCWRQMLANDHPQKQWAIETLLPWIQDNDNAPAELLALRDKCAKKESVTT